MTILEMKLRFWTFSRGVVWKLGRPHAAVEVHEGLPYLEERLVLWNALLKEGLNKRLIEGTPYLEERLFKGTPYLEERLTEGSPYWRNALFRGTPYWRSALLKECLVWRNAFLKERLIVGTPYWRVALTGLRFQRWERVERRCNGHRWWWRDGDDDDSIRKQGRGLSRTAGLRGGVGV